MVNSLLPVLL